MAKTYDYIKNAFTENIIDRYTFYSKEGGTYFKCFKDVPKVDFVKLNTLNEEQSGVLKEWNTLPEDKDVLDRIGREVGNLPCIYVCIEAKVDKVIMTVLPHEEWVSAYDYTEYGEKDYNCNESTSEMYRAVKKDYQFYLKKNLSNYLSNFIDIGYLKPESKSNMMKSLDNRIVFDITYMFNCTMLNCNINIHKIVDDIYYTHIETILDNILSSMYPDSLKRNHMKIAQVRGDTNVFSNSSYGMLSSIGTRGDFIAKNNIGDNLLFVDNKLIDQCYYVDKINKSIKSSLISNAPSKCHMSRTFYNFIKFLECHNQYMYTGNESIKPFLSRKSDLDYEADSHKSIVSLMHFPIIRKLSIINKNGFTIINKFNIIGGTRDENDSIINSNGLKIKNSDITNEMMTDEFLDRVKVRVDNKVVNNSMPNDEKYVESEELYYNKLILCYDGSSLYMASKYIDEYVIYEIDRGGSICLDSTRMMMCIDAITDVFDANRILKIENDKDPNTEKHLKMFDSMHEIDIAAIGELHPVFMVFKSVVLIDSHMVIHIFDWNEKKLYSSGDYYNMRGKEIVGYDRYDSLNCEIMDESVGKHIPYMFRDSNNISIENALEAYSILSSVINK